MTVSGGSIDWRQQAYELMCEDRYSEAARLYEEAIASAPDIKSHYWHLGLVLLLQGEETEAHTTWLAAMMEGEPEEVEAWTTELIEVLQAEAARRQDLAEYAVAWLIRQHIRELQPAKLDNLLYLILLEVELERFTGDGLTEWGLVELLQATSQGDIDANLLLQVLKNVLKAAALHPQALEFAGACCPHLRHLPELLPVLLLAAIDYDHILREPLPAVYLAQLALDLELNLLERAEVLRHLATFYQDAENYDKGIETAKLCYALVENVADKIFANHLLMRGLMGAGGYWDEVLRAFKLHQSLLSALVTEPLLELHPAAVTRIFSSAYFLPYIKDDPQSNRAIMGQVSQWCQTKIQNRFNDRVEQYREGALARKRGARSQKKLKIGYVSHCLRRHSVGWLARWLLEHHDRSRFEIYGYFISYKPNDPVQEWYASHVHYPRPLEMNTKEIADRIAADEIDIAIDVDSITLDTTCEVMALKPAPVQVTWLGWDASGLPAIDYYIADPYVLPESAQDYYTEKIWRLPQTYIAVDGFEVGVPTLRRDRLDIPTDGVVYFSGQRGYKRHPDTARLQMKIIKEVPNSYFLIKGISDKGAVETFFTQIAEEEGVDISRLRFLPQVGAEATHRADLGIADVVLDTYPYNGATTTLETLWMGIPIITRVGEQFAARNSYTMMVNAGITEGIAWTDEEYVEWGMRLGKDAKLRQEISWKLRQSRKTAPLWNGKQFAREMENAYEQMWQRYLEGT